MASSSDKNRASNELKCETRNAPKMNETDVEFGSADIIDGRIFESDNPLALSDKEQAEMNEFQNTRHKYYEISKQQRLDTLRREKEELDKVHDKSTLLKYAQDGDKTTVSDRKKQIEIESGIIEEMNSLKENRKKIGISEK